MWGVVWGVVWGVGVVAAVVWALWGGGWGEMGRGGGGARTPATGPGPGAAAPGASASASVVEPEAEVFARYAGSVSCRDCHTNAFAAWASSHHGLAEREPTEALDRMAFDPARGFRHGTQETSVRSTPAGYEIVTPGLSGPAEAHRVSRVLGHDPLRQYLVPAPGGRWQALEACWDPRTNEWFNVYGAEDRRPGEWGHWTGRGMNWNSMCGTCHNTRFRKNYEASTDSYRTTMAEVGVGCEACHGPMKEHVRWQRAWQGQGKTDPTLRKRTPAEAMENCAPCHARRSELTGDLVPDGSFWDHYLLAIVDGGDVFHPDGQVRDEDYEFTAFLGSRMHAAGVTCLDCHDPHAGPPRLAGDALCLRCHNGSRAGSPVIDPARHTFHAPESTGSRCVNCHMPQTVYMQRHSRHDHGFTSPDPVLTREFGIPNACSRCHADKDLDWVQSAAERWYGTRLERPARARTRALAAARRGDEAVVARLLTLLGTPETPYWKAAALALLERWVGRPDVAGALSRELSHPHPLVRVRAIQGLGPRVEGGDAEAARALRPRLDDPVRSVRYAAAWALRREIDPESRAGRELAHGLALNADQPAGQAQWASYELARGRTETAAKHLGTAVGWDPGSSALRHDYAVTLSLLGKAREALEQVKAAVRLEPGVAENHYRLGLAWAEAGDLKEAERSLAEATRLDPGNGRGWYNLALAQNGLGRPEDAIGSLLRAEAADPRDGGIPYARATVLARMGRIDEARAAVHRALALNPHSREAAELLEALRSR